MSDPKRAKLEGLASAIDIAEKCGVGDPYFYGDITIRIKGGGVAAVDVRQTFLGEKQGADQKA